MKNLIILILIISFSLVNPACSSIGNTTIQNVIKDKSFDPLVFFKSDLCIYKPFIVTYDENLFPEVKYEEFTASVLGIIKSEILAVSDSAKVRLESRTADEILFGVKAHNSNYKSNIDEILKSEKSDFMIIIQQLSVLINTKNYKMYVKKLPTTPYTKYPPPSDDNSYDKVVNKKEEIIETTIYFDIWDVKQRKCVLAVEVSGDYKQRFFDFDQFSNIKKATEDLIDYLQNPFKK